MKLPSYNFLTEFGIPMNLVRLIKMCLTEKCSRVWVGKNLNFMFPIWNGLKQGDVWGHCFSTLLLNRPLEGYWVIQDGLKLNGEHQILLHADDNILGGSTHTVKENAEALVGATKETGLEVNADKSKYMVMSRDQNAEEVTVWRLILLPLKGWKSSNICEQF